MFKLKTVLTGHQNPIYSLAITADSSRLFSAGADKGIVEWDLTQGKFKKVFAPLKQSAYFIYYFEHYLAVADRLGKISIYDLKTDQAIANFQAGDKAIFSLCYIASKKELISAGEDGQLRVWNPLKGELLATFKLSDQALRCQTLDTRNNYLIIGAKNGSIYVLNIVDFTLLYTLEAHSAGVTALAFHPTERLLLSGSRDASLKVWDIDNWNVVHNFTAHMNTIYGIVFHPKLPWFATCSQDKSIKIWNGEDYRLLKILSVEKLQSGHKHTVNSICWANQGEILVSTGDDRQVILWELSHPL
ncbi:MAG: WD40 repeat domain-containing protein [Pedobacter sp.]|nr:MAG: WD40 repeat domain-containing protein [Pedobacter sp.]